MCKLALVKFMGVVFGFVVLLGAAASSPGQSAITTAARVEAMKKLDLWVGEWKGSGWNSMGQGERTEFTITEKVQRRVGGSVLLVEGRSVGKADGAVIHDGLALVYYDDKTKCYHWHGHDVPWGAMDAEVKLVDEGFEWSLPVKERKATVRFTIKFDQKQWHEVGDVSVDGKTWRKFMEMTLKRQK